MFIDFLDIQQKLLSYKSHFSKVFWSDREQISCSRVFLISLS